MTINGDVSPEWSLRSASSVEVEADPSVYSFTVPYINNRLRAVLLVYRPGSDFHMRETIAGPFRRAQTSWDGSSQLLLMPEEDASAYA